MTSAIYYQTMLVPQQQQQTAQQVPIYYHSQQQMTHQIQQPVHHHLISSVPQTTTRESQHQRTPIATTKEMTKPKGRMSAYTFFVQQCRDEHRKAFPNENANFSEFSKRCAEKWKTMTESDKSKFAAQAEIDKQRYEREMATYQPGEKRTKKKKKDPLAPKRPLSAFFHYCKEERPKLKALNPSLSVGDIAKELGDRWNHTTPDGKHIYEEAAQRDKERYEKEMNEFKSANKKATKTISSSQVSSASPTPAAVPQIQQQQQQQQMRIHPDSQQYAPSSYQMPTYTTMQSFPNQNFTQMNNYQDNGTTTYSNYNGYSLPMTHNNTQMQNYSPQIQHVQHQTYQTLTTVNTNPGYDDIENGLGNDDDDDIDDHDDHEQSDGDD